MPITRGVRRGDAALRATGAVAVRRTRQGVSGLPAVLQGGAAWLRTSATCRQRQQAAPQRPWRRPANAATAAAPLTPQRDAAAARPRRCRRNRRHRRRGSRQGHEVAHGPGRRRREGAGSARLRMCEETPRHRCPHALLHTVQRRRVAALAPLKSTRVACLTRATWASGHTPRDPQRAAKAGRVWGL